jgi:transposase
VTADGAPWIRDVVAERCPHAELALDPFHVVSWATQALDALRREAWTQARRAAGGTRPGGYEKGKPLRRSIGKAQQLGRSRYALLKNPENLTTGQRAKLEWIATSDPSLYRGYLLKEGLRTIFRLPPDEAPAALDRWISWARRSRLHSFVALQQRISRHRKEILTAIDHRLSNGLIESVNSKIRLITRIAFGFHGPEPLIALAMLSLGGQPPALPRP